MVPMLSANMPAFFQQQTLGAKLEAIGATIRGIQQTVDKHGGLETTFADSSEPPYQQARAC